MHHICSSVRALLNVGSRAEHEQQSMRVTNQPHVGQTGVVVAVLVQGSSTRQRTTRNLVQASGRCAKRYVKLNSPTKEPMPTRAAIAPQTAAIPALPKSVLVRSMLSRMTGRRAAGAKVETNAAKKASQDRWNAAICGLLKYLRV